MYNLITHTYLLTFLKIKYISVQLENSSCFGLKAKDKARENAVKFTLDGLNLSDLNVSRFWTDVFVNLFLTAVITYSSTLVLYGFCVEN